MYVQQDPINAKLTIAANLGNLTSCTSQNVDYLAVHDTKQVSIIGLSAKGTIAKEFLLSSSSQDNQNIIARVKFILVQDKHYLAVGCMKTIKIFMVENDFQLVFEHTLDSEYKSSIYVHSIEVLGTSLVCIATQNQLYFFKSTGNGTFQLENLTIDWKTNPRSSIYQLVSNGISDCGLVQNTGTMTFWTLNDKSSFVQTSLIEIHPNTKTTCLRTFKHSVILGTISGQIQIIDTRNGRLLCEIQAHIKSITSIDVEEKSGFLISGSEDSHVRLFEIMLDNIQECKVCFVQQITLFNEMICGVNFINSDHKKIAISSYESSAIHLFKLDEDSNL